MNVDKKIKELGFRKIGETEKYCTFERYDKQHDYQQIVDIRYRTVWNTFAIKSYDKDLMDEHKIGNTCVALTLEEVELFAKKMKQMNKKYNA